MPQVVYYHPGVGSTESSRVARIVEGATGGGIVRDIAESYRFICDNYSFGDEIILIGFSRGAFTARSVAQMVCSLGFLNGAGLDQFPHIYDDYRTWHKWNRQAFDENKHLYLMLLCTQRRKHWEPIAGHVQAVCVWDTVGSLGIPRLLPLQIRFLNPNVHRGVNYAFHAMALDEWRQVFNCTLWGKRGNNNTRLRQVWFPGNHGNVGGGWEDQQIATIALAWMADQLTSIGVEFSETEMSRIFYSMHPKARARHWALGLIRNPTGLTAVPDKIWSYIAAPYRMLTRGTTDYPTRTPGDYVDDKREKLVNPNELVHPCVRIRYLYGGLNLDDAGPWTCRALTERGYRLERRDGPAIQIRKGHDSIAEAAYYSLRGPVTPYYDGVLPSDTAAGTDENPLVKVEQPHEGKLCQLPEPRSYWVWKRTKDGIEQELPEEHIGMWERLFIRITEQLVKWQRDGDDKQAAAAARAKKGVFRWAVDATKSAWKFVRPPRRPPPSEAAKLNSPMIPQTYGYHDLVSWQKGDTNPQPSKNSTKSATV
ncbi:hypothetical protein N657DRAFT_600853 [Parathielavia appendiculata]|uniref:T6SS Phospholipase effector Tle1-like catalytic domain-containing protein n=1 Tax=Parathielavia appendiculata TaxID=2587402 RepID=A0AAN6Z1A0_9PEZI|nr:hypothetical protein N657DRAFT_600853 [Parathielavia appendiculata]